MARRLLVVPIVGLLAAALMSAANGQVANERAATDSALAAERAAVDAAFAQKDARIAELEATVVALEARIAELEAAPQEPSCDASVSGGSLQAALDAAPQGATVCLSGTFTVTSTVSPKDNQTLRGPATIVGQGVADVIRVKPAVGVTLEQLYISGGSRHGVACGIGTTVIGGRIHHNDKDGIGCDLEGRPSDNLVDGVEIDHNGSDAWLGKGAAGIKWFHAHGVTVTNSHVHSNYGNGVWCDAHCGDFTVTDSVIEGNLRKGAFYEKGGASDGSFLGRTWAVYEGRFVVTGNVIRGNDTEGTPSANAGVSIYSSKHALVSGNTFGGNGRAVIAREDAARLADDKHGWPLEDIVIEDNSLNGDELVGCGSAGVTCLGNV